MCPAGLRHESGYCGPGGLSHADRPTIEGIRMARAAKNAETETLQAGPTTQLAEQTVAPGDVEMVINLELPSGYRLDNGSPSSITVSTPDRPIIAFGPLADVTVSQPRFPLRIPAAADEGQTGIDIHLAIYFCGTDESQGPCHFHESRLSLPVKVAAGAGKKMIVSCTVPPPPKPEENPPPGAGKKRQI